MRKCFFLICVLLCPLSVIADNYLNNLPSVTFVENGIKYYEEITVPGKSSKVLLPNRGAIDPKDVGIIVNTAEAGSEEIGIYYRNTYNIPPANLVRIYLPTLPQVGVTSLDPQYMYSTRLEDYLPALQKMNSDLPQNVQILVLAFSKPFKIYCNDDTPQGYGDISINVALSMGVKACSQVVPNFPIYDIYSSPNYNEVSARPFDDFKIRPSMMLMSSSVNAAKSYIQRSKTSYGTQPRGNFYFANQFDVFKFKEYWNRSDGVTTIYSNDYPAFSNVLFSSYGDKLSGKFVPGAFAFDSSTFQNAAVVYKVLENGAAASIGTIANINPLNPNGSAYFPETDVDALLKNYFSGASVIEAVWSSLGKWFFTPGIYFAVIVGDPLARPFAPVFVNGASGGIAIRTTALQPNRIYQLMAGNDLSNLSPVGQEFSISKHAKVDLQLGQAAFTYYKVEDKGSSNSTPPRINLDGGQWLGYKKDNYRKLVITSDIEDDNATVGTDYEIKLVKYYFDGYFICNSIPSQTYLEVSSVCSIQYASHNPNFFPDGKHKLTIRAFDKGGNVTNFSTDMYYTTANDTAPPAIQLYSPGLNEKINFDTVISGKVNDDTFVDKIFAYVQANPSGASFGETGWIKIPLTKEFSFTFKDLIPSAHVDSAVLKRTDYPLMIRINGLDAAGKNLDFKYPFQFDASAADPKVTPVPVSTWTPAGTQTKPLIITSPQKGRHYLRKLLFQAKYDPSKVITKGTLSLDGRTIKFKAQKGQIAKNIKLPISGRHIIMIKLNFSDGSKTSQAVKFMSSK